MKAALRRVPWWLLMGVIGFLVLPWYVIEEGFFSPQWLPYYPDDPELAPAPLQALRFGKGWLLPLALPLLAALSAARYPSTDPRRTRVFVAAGLAGLIYIVVQGFSIGALGINWSWLANPLFDGRQFGMGAGGLLTTLCFLLMVADGLAGRGWLRGDVFIVGSLFVIGGSIAAFVLLPVTTILLRAFETEAGEFDLTVFTGNLLSAQVWGVPFITGGRWGVAWRSLLLGVLTGAGTTALGLAFALLATRTRLPGRRLLRGLTILPIITPPFVLGLALILVFGRAGALTVLLEDWFQIPATRYIFGLPGILVAQLLGFTPIAFLVLIGVVEGVSPSVEEAAQTLGASRFKTFTSVSLPLMKPGIANAFLLGFIESLADFGNPMVLGGSYDVLATEIYFAVAGAQHDTARAAALALVLLSFTLTAFYLQRRWVGTTSYTTMTGKADSGEPCPLPRGILWPAACTALPWAAFTVAMYAIVMFGGFVHTLGRDNSFTLAHYVDMFSFAAEWSGTLPSVQWTGGAWDSLFTTIEVAAFSAPITAAMGLMTAYLLARQRFAGHAAFEFGTMLSFAIPGTVIGVSYILAFNVPPIELTGTGTILIVCFVFRNMPVGIRAGVASLSQIDRSLDEASTSLGADTFTTVRRVVLPLLRPAVVAALVYGFVRAMTAISAVIFLVSADYNLATTYILGRVELGNYGPAIAYSSVLVVLMLAAIGSIQLLVGKRNVGRRNIS